MKLKALYYPYARSFDRAMLKQAVLLFDEIWFSDPLDRAARGVIMSSRTPGGWESIIDDYHFLHEKGLIKIFNPEPTVREYDGLMAQSLICDMENKEFVQLVAESINQGQGHWGILSERISDIIFDKWMDEYKQTPHPFRSKSIPLLHEEATASIKWTGVGRGGLLIDSDGRPYDKDDSPYISSLVHNYIPARYGYSININHALLVSQAEGLTLFTDDVVALRLLNLKYQRAKSQAGSLFMSSLLIKRTPEYLAKYNLLAINIIQALLPSRELEKRSFEDIVRFREANRETFERFHSYLFELTSEISSELWSEALESEILKIIDTKIVPEAIKVRDSTHTAYEKMFGSIIQKSAAIVTPTLVASFLSGLSSGQILTLSCAAFAGVLSIALPEIVGLWQDERQNKRNSLSFLLDLKASHMRAHK